MADVFTPNYGFVLPEVGGSPDTWGDKLNQNWTEADGVLNTLDQGLNGLSQDITSVEQDVSTLQGRSLTAGNGLTGGGTLAADRTFTLGTPGTLNGGTSNAVTASSHTHSITSTSSRTNGSNTTLLAAAAMNSHRTSGDHDGRYYTKAQVDDRIELVNISGWGDVVRTKMGHRVWFQVPMTVSQNVTNVGGVTKVQFTTDTSFNASQATPWFLPPTWYNTSSHRFIAPVSGLYMFYAQVLRTPDPGSNVAVNISFRVNGDANTKGPQGFGPGPGDFVNGDNIYFSARIDMMIWLEPGDYVEVYQSGGPVTLLGSVNEKASYFGGYLL